MTTDDAARWDRTWAERAHDEPAVAVPAAFAPFADQFPTTGAALEIACGPGGASVWLAARGLATHGVDVSSEAVQRATQLATTHRLAHRCRFTVHDLDDGLPHGPAAAVVLCHRFRDPDLYPAIIDRLAPGGIAAIAVLSAAGAEPGRFRAAPGELTDAFASLDIVGNGEGDGQAWLVGRRPS